MLWRVTVRASHVSQTRPTATKMTSSSAVARVIATIIVRGCRLSSSHMIGSVTGSNKGRLGEGTGRLRTTQSRHCQLSVMLIIPDWSEL